VVNATTGLSIGRFAPSPTGPLHLGSLLTAVASFLQARSRGGRWLVRIEDLDTPRSVPGASDRILRTLERHALYWDGSVLYQHDRVHHYVAAIERLTAAGHTFACTCSRSQLNDRIYPGRCRNNGNWQGNEPHSVRLVVPAATLGLDDAIQGRYAQRLDKDVGDFVILRRDGIVAYQLAVVVDDIDQRITEVVRGADLLDNTPRQLLLFELLGAPAPRYAHVPVLIDRTGQKLSKQTFASAVEEQHPGVNLNLMLTLLGHEPPTQLRSAAPDELIGWAVQHWDLARVPRGATLAGFVCT
jgi:glutamyl-Q tRNA(Asp) synthetase